MTDAYKGKLRYVDSVRLRLVAATPELVQCDLDGEGLSASLGATVPDNWPPELYDHQAMDYASRELSEGGQLGWSFWYLLLKCESEKVLAGISGFKGRPDERGSVELGYSVLEQFRGQGLATEAAMSLVSWAFTHPNVTQISAETLPHLRASIRVLEKSGFSFSGPGSEYGVIRYQLERSSLA